MPLLPEDARALAARGLRPTVTDENGMTCVVFEGWRLPEGYTRPSADLLVRLPAGFPDIAPDMWWFDPEIVRIDGATIPQTQLVESYVGRATWQRWSRHFNPGQWRSGIDSLETFLGLIRQELVACSGRPAA